MWYTSVSGEYKRFLLPGLLKVCSHTLVSASSAVQFSSGYGCFTSCEISFLATLSCSSSDHCGDFHAGHKLPSEAQGIVLLCSHESPVLICHAIFLLTHLFTTFLSLSIAFTFLLNQPANPHSSLQPASCSNSATLSHLSNLLMHSNRQPSLQPADPLLTYRPSITSPTCQSNPTHRLIPAFQVLSPPPKKWYHTKSMGEIPLLVKKICKGTDIIWCSLWSILFIVTTI